MPNGERVAKRDRVIITSEFILPFEHACISANFKYSTLVFVLNLVFARQIHSHFVDKFKHRLQVICIEMSSARLTIWLDFVSSGVLKIWYLGAIWNSIGLKHLKALQTIYSHTDCLHTSQAMTDALPMEISQKFR